MNISDIQNAVAAYVSEGTKTPSQLTFNGLDMTLLALNNAQKNAQKLHDFEYSKALVDVTVDLQTGTNLSAAVLHGTSTPVSVKSILGASLQARNGFLRSMEFVGRGDLAQRFFEQARGNDTQVYDDRYPADGEQGWLRDRILYQMGQTVYVYPGSKTAGETAQVTLECSLWLSEYTSSNIATTVTVAGATTPSAANGTYTQQGLLNGQPLYYKYAVNVVPYVIFYALSGFWVLVPASDMNLSSIDNCFLSEGNPATTWSAGGTFVGIPTVTSSGIEQSDFLTEYGSGWLIWEAVMEANMLTKNFVSRQEGNINLSDVAKKRDEEWRKLLIWDSYLIEGGRVPTLR